jgi:hypothetical protein
VDRHTSKFTTCSERALHEDVNAAQHASSEEKRLLLSHPKSHHGSTSWSGRDDPGSWTEARADVNLECLT